MCHDMCKCFGRVGENREGMETGDAGREGGDAAICVALVKGETQIAVDIGKRTFISIHAPAKGATRPLTRPSSSARYFNPRSREGSDVQRLLSKRTQYHFNPRSREGSDNSSSHSCRQIKNFNPRSREGSDGDQAVFTPVSVISIHAPVKGATATIRIMIIGSLFQSTLP